jgi:uncharacterized protein (TIGR00251 family)
MEWGWAFFIKTLFTERGETMREREIDFKITNAEGGAAFPVRVVPRASKNEISGRHGDAVKIRLTAAPVEGAANEALVDFLAEVLDVRKSQIEILSGHTSRDKVVCVIGLTPRAVEERLGGHSVKGGEESAPEAEA